MITHTEENYLKAIYKISEKNKQSVSTNAISERISTTAASVTDMIKRLSSKALVNYERYKGVTLTEDGNRHATNLIRKHRLWEVFLVEKLGFQWDEVHELAEELEHIQSEELANKLDSYLGNPKFDPHGDPIPNAEGKFTLRAQTPLTAMGVETQGTLIGVKVHDKPFLSHLNSLKIKLGTKLNVLSNNNYDGSVTVLIDEEKEATLSHKVANNLLIKTNS